MGESRRGANGRSIPIKYNKTSLYIGNPTCATYKVKGKGSGVQPTGLVKLLPRPLALLLAAQHCHWRAHLQLLPPQQERRRREERQVLLLLLLLGCQRELELAPPWRFRRPPLLQPALLARHPAPLLQAALLPWHLAPQLPRRLRVLLVAAG